MWYHAFLIRIIKLIISADANINIMESTEGLNNTLNTQKKKRKKIRLVVDVGLGLSLPGSTSATLIEIPFVLVYLLQIADRNQSNSRRSKLKSCTVK